jgi:hypothetical protein
MDYNSNNSVPATMLVGPTGYGNGGGFGGFGSDGWWLILLLLCGWGGMGFGGMGGWGGMMGMGMMDGFGLYPWLNNSQNINSGFRDQMLNDNITSIRDGIYNIGPQLCNGFNGVTAAVNGAQNALSQQMYTNQIADMERSYAAQTANTQGFFGVQSGLSDVRFTTATEGCATRTANANNTRDIIDSQTRGTQAILDKLCALELDGYKRENDQLRSQLQFANMQASQVEQTAQLRASQATTANQLVAELRSCPIPAQPVYGNTPIFTCASNLANNGCGCGNNFTGFAA